MNMIYNENIKNKFLAKYDCDTKEVYMRIFKISSKIEDKLNKDLANFNEEEFEYLIKYHIKPKTKQSARTYCNVLVSYVQWAIEDGYSNLMVNPLRRRQEYFYKFVEDQNSLYLSKEKIDDILSGLINCQDKIIIKGLFAGIHGQRVSELTSLTIDQIIDAKNNNNKLKLINDKGEERMIVVDDETIDIAIAAHSEREYYKKNGEADYYTNIKDVVILPESKYILRATVTNGNVSDRPVSHYTVYNRLEMIKSLDEYSEYRDALTTKNIVRSGMIYQAKQLYDQGEELDRKNIEIICENFGMNYKWSLKDFLNEETIRSVYNCWYMISAVSVISAK